MNASNEVKTNRSVLAGDESEETASPLPTGLEPLPNQVAGHKYGEKGSKNYLLKERNTGFVLKQIGDKRGLRESQFYENLFANNCCPKLMNLRQFVPLYRGRVTMNGSQFIALDDICASFRCPCVMDVKIGAVTYDHEASAEKIEKESSKYPPAREIGFRILGIRVSIHLIIKF
ncbi:inositol polyphosphate multikinase-like protein [Leptotrombidium deliense]|uniref:Kinase n=1 Tax=Leptotrombidium deliense TaxID=299467 RepID=A0A443S7Q7_9ACAR|nr:inositol polyphosphate multikinase-like protein [Leptotrombidium deliense]